jgi:two-component system cell cycle response regulator DivK
MKRTVLLVEDNEQNAYLVKILLEPCGYEVVAASDGQRALEMALTFVPHLILLDIQLPTMDGYTVARRLREIESLREVPIVAVTSYAMLGDREKAIEAGCTGYIEKPIDPETFVTEVEQVATPTLPGKEPPCNAF